MTFYSIIMKLSDILVGFGLFGLLASGCEGCGTGDPSSCDCEILTTVEEDAVASASAPSGSISTYEYQGEFLADAACHAEMFIYFEWLDSARARTTEIPPLSVNFETPLGYFTTPSVRTIETLISTGPTGDVIHRKYFHAINEAENKNSPEATSYKISWTYDASYTPDGSVNIGAYIKSRLYDPEEYARTNQSECAN